MNSHKKDNKNSNSKMLLNNEEHDIAIKSYYIDNQKEEQD